jgi:hypothetical protein
MYALGIDGRELERDLEAVRRLLPRPIRSLGRRMPALIETAADLSRTELEARGIIGRTENGRTAKDMEATRA